MSNKVFTQGFWFNDPSPNAPDFVIGNVKVKVQNFVAWLNEHDEDDEVRISIVRDKNGKPYAALDTWKPSKPDNAEVANAENDLTDSPF